LSFNIQFAWGWLLLPVLGLPFVIFGFGLGILLSFFSVFSSDVKNITTIVIRYGLFLSAVIFPLPTAGFVGAIVACNPLYHMIENTRNLLVHGFLPNPTGYSACIALAAGVFLFALKKTCAMENRLVWAL